MPSYVPYDEEAAAPATGKFVPYEGEAAALQAPQAQPSSNARPVTGSELLRQLGLAARIPVHAATGTLGVVSDALTGLYNEAANLYDKKRTPSMSELVTGKQPGFRFQSVTPTLNKLMTQLGLPEPATPLERGVQFGGQVLTGGADPALVATQRAAQAMAPAGFQAARTTPTANQTTAKELQDAGLKLLPTQTGGGAVTRTMEGAGGVERTHTLFRQGNQPALQVLAAKDTNLKPGNLTEAALNAASRDISKETYEPVRQLGTIRMGRLYKNELDDIAREFSSIDQAPQIQRRLQDLYVNKLPADATLERISQLRSDAADAFRGDNRNYGRALRKMADALENQIELNLPARSAVLENYRAGRTQIAKNNAVKEMLVDKHTGIIDTTKAQKLLEDGVPLTDNLLTIAKAGSPMFAPSTKPPIKGAGTPINWGDWMMGGGFGLAGAATAGPVGLFAAGVPPVARSAARHIIASGPVQRSMARNLVAQPNTGPYADLLQRIPAGLIAPLFSQGEQ